MISSARKLRPYFQGHPIRIPTSYPLCQVLQNPELSGRIAKWAIELGEFDIEFVSRTVIKSQALTDFVTEFTRLPGLTLGDTERTVDSPIVKGNKAPDQVIEWWKLFVDESSNFKTSNNEAEYKE